MTRTLLIECGYASMCGMMVGTMEGTAAGSVPPEALAALTHTPIVIATPCADCEKPIDAAYFVRNGDAICPSCHTLMEGSPRIALAYGLAASVASIAVYYAIYFALHARFVFIAVLAGVVVGSGVRRGAQASRRLGYRWLALLLTYLAVVATYAHSLAEMPGVTDALDAAIRSLYLPFLMILGQKNLVVLVLLGF